MEQLNSGINFSMFDEYGVKKELIEEVSKDPAKLVELFMGVTSEQWHAKAGKSIGEIFKKIESLDSEGKFNETQINNIIKIASEIYPMQDGEEIKDAFSNFLIKQVDDGKINTSNVFSYLKYSKRMDHNESISKCLQFLQNETGVTFIMSNSSLSIDVKDSKISLEKLSQQITDLSEIFEGKIEIAYTPQNSTLLPDIEKFIEKHGKSIRLLNLNNLGGQVNDDFTKKFIKSCPNLYQIFINSDKITNGSLEELSHLKSLTTLNLSGCSGLTALPADLPESLTTLNLSGCTA